MLTRLTTRFETIRKARDPRSRLRVLRVGQGGGEARLRFHRDFDAGLDELFDGGGHCRDPLLAFLKLSEERDLHGAPGKIYTLADRDPVRQPLPAH